jgi:hypothetical protein
MPWGGDRNLAMRVALGLPAINSPEGADHVCFVDLADLIVYSGEQIGPVSLALSAHGLSVSPGKTFDGRPTVIGWAEK